MKGKIYVYSIGFLFISTIMVCTNPIIASEEKEYMSNNEIYEYGFIALDCWSILGLPEGEYVGGLNEVDITTKGLTQGFIFTMPSSGSKILIENNDIHIHMENFLGVSVSYSCGAGSIVGIGKNIEWEIM